VFRGFVVDLFWFFRRRERRKRANRRDLLRETFTFLFLCVKKVLSLICFGFFGEKKGEKEQTAEIFSAKPLCSYFFASKKIDGEAS
jgi:hypothetical protein